MNSQLLDLDRLLLILFAVLFLRVAWQLYVPRFRRRWKRVKARLPRRWKPRSPKDCPHCCQGLSLESRPVQREVEPYAERKSTRGRKKETSTAGFACLNPLCDFFGITDDQVHALVGNGKRGIKGDIQHFRCQWCRTDFSSRRNTPLYYLKTAPDRIEMVLWLMAEGVDISVMVRYTGHAESTISRWLQRMGAHSTLLHNRYFQGLVLNFVQLDELYAKVRTGIQWLWLAIDPVTKIIPSLHLGGRKQEDAYALLHDLHLRLHDDCVPAFTSDGLRSYFYAITAHFGYWFRPERARTDHWHVTDDLLYGQLIKRKQSYRLTFTITRMLWGSRKAFYQLLTAQGFHTTIQTAFIERVNLTIRRGVAPLMRKTWSLAQSPQHLLLHTQWWRTYYHFVRPHDSLQLPVPGLPRARFLRTPAMAAGVTEHLWSVGTILKKPLYPPLPG
jgi:transposase-like protein